LPLEIIKGFPLYACLFFNNGKFTNNSSLLKLKKAYNSLIISVENPHLFQPSNKKTLVFIPNYLLEFALSKIRIP
jgi:hypothetical protein